VQASRLFAVGVVLASTLAAAPSRGGATPAMAEPGAARALSRAFAAVAQAIAPSVVRLEVSGAKEAASGSGIIIDTRGDVVTSSHLFDGWSPAAGGEAEAVAVVLVDGRRVAAELVGLDAASDVAVVRMRQAPSDLSAARFGDSDGASVGEWVLAVGSPLGLDQTITAGIISGRSEVDADEDGAPPRRRYLLTDANANPGDSGGPLVDLEGEVVGLTTAVSGGPGGSCGYAVPINRVRRVAVALIREGHALHPYIGVGLRDLRDLDAGERRRLGAMTGQGALVSRVWRGAPAARAGLRAGDVITSVNNREVPTPQELVELISEQEVGAQIVVGFLRNGSDRVVPLSIADLPVAARPFGGSVGHPVGAWGRRPVGRASERSLASPPEPPAGPPGGASGD
jgi:serine protease Do